MKVNVEIDCSPDEARQLMGLPDVEKANAVYMDAISSAMKGVTSTGQLEEYAKQLAPMGHFGLQLFQNFMDVAVSQAGMMTPDSNGKKSGSK